MFGLEARGAAAAFKHAVAINAARVKKVGVLEHPGRSPMDPVGEASVGFVAHRVTAASDRPWCKPRGGRTITVTENAGVVVELDWDNLAGIFSDKAIPFAPRKRTVSRRPFFRPLFRSRSLTWPPSNIAEDTQSETETPGGSGESGPTTVYDCAKASNEVRGEDGRPAADREARERGSIAAGSSRRTKHSRPRLRRSSYHGGTSDLFCEHADRCSPEAALRFHADDGDAGFLCSDDDDLELDCDTDRRVRRRSSIEIDEELFSPNATTQTSFSERAAERAADDLSALRANGDDEATEQNAAGNPEPPRDGSVARAYDALVGRRWDQLLQAINPPPAKQPSVRH